MKILVLALHQRAPYMMGPGGGGAHGFFLGGDVPPGTPNGHSFLKNKFP